MGKSDKLSASQQLMATWQVEYSQATGKHAKHTLASGG